ncbi:NHL repeat protein [Caballeronia fortuita]|uniref:NHL repeat protein n=1 Tax=Caballeronia fortuita TaxID=1777138 RepID=A0A158CVF4_9BURK|nr:NHL repeat protein [Caballeronia fortuita]
MKQLYSIPCSSAIARLVVVGTLAGFLCACGGGSPSSANNSAPPPPVVPQPAINVFAGVVDATGNVDGPVRAAQFNYAQGLVSDNAGDIFVADTDNYTIRKISNGVVTTIAGTPGKAGSADGVGNGALFEGPQQIATDRAGNLYVTDQGPTATVAVIRKITPAGQVTTLIDSATNVAVQTDGSDAIGTDSNANVYFFMSTPTQPSVLAQITPGGTVNVISLEGITNGASLALVNPQAIAIDQANNLYVSDDDLNAGAGVLYKMQLSGTHGVVTTLAGSTEVQGGTDGPGTVATFNGLTTLALDPAGNIYASYFFNKTIREISPAGVVSTVAGVPGQTNLVTGPLPAPLPDLGGLLFIGQALYSTDVDDNVILSIGPLQ